MNPVGAYAKGRTWVRLWVLVVGAVVIGAGLAVFALPASGATRSGESLALSVSPAAGSLQIVSITVTPNPVVQGSSISVNAVVNGGQPPYTYSWTNLPNPCSAGNQSSWGCSPNNPGQYTIFLNVTDVGHNTTPPASSSLSVVSVLVINSINISPNPVSQGSQFQVSANVGGGASPYTFDWTGTPSGCSPGNQASWQCPASQTGNFPISLTVHDSAGQQKSSQVSLTVNGNSNNGGGNGNGNGNGNGSNNGNSSNGLNLSGLGPVFFYVLIAGVVGFALLVALTVGVIMIAVTLRRLPKVPKHGLSCPSCNATAPPGSKFCPACAAPLTPPAK